jgi:hypothetical protein
MLKEETVAIDNVLKLVKSGELDRDYVIRTMLNYMGEQTVQDMAYATSLFATEEDWDYGDD